MQKTYFFTDVKKWYRFVKLLSYRWRQRYDNSRGLY